MRQICRVLASFWLGTVAVLTVGLAADAPTGKVGNPADPAAVVDAAPANDSPAQEALPLAESQDAINARYKRFEKTMLDMVRFLEKTDPDRAAILNRAISRSQTDGVGLQMEKLVEVLRDQNQLGDAVERQDEVVTDLQALLDLLMSDDREKELAKEKARIEQYLKDLNKIIAGQKDVRAATERNEPGKSLAPRQEKLTEKTQDLGKLIDSDDHSRKPLKSDNAESKPGESKPKSNGEPNESKPGAEEKPESKPGDKPDEAKPDGDKPKEPGKKPGEEKPGEQKPGDPSKPGESPSESQPSESQPGESQPGESPPGESKPGESKPGESNSKPSQQPPKTQGREELEKAKKAMEKAIEKLQQEIQKDAAKNQDEALRELQKAKEKLEEILRQLREEERLLHLAGLEARFQRMLAQQIAIYNDTVQIDKVPQAERVSRHQLKSEEMALQESELVLEASKALTLLKEEGTAVAFPEAVEQMRFDMQTVADQLKQQDVGKLTQTIELDIIDGLKEMIDALQSAIDKAKEKEQKPMDQQDQQGQQEEEELLKKIAELKMLKSLQVRINSRTTKLGQLYSGEQATQPEIVRQVQELAIRQARIQRATYDLAVGKNK